jgi:hypothetical protein
MWTDMACTTGVVACTSGPLTACRIESKFRQLVSLSPSCERRFAGTMLAMSSRWLAAFCAWLSRATKKTGLKHCVDFA